MAADTINLTGLTWDHPRGVAPLQTTAAKFRQREAANKTVSITWDVRSLLDFAEIPLHVLAESYDLLVIDHPHVGSAADSGTLLAFDDFLPDDHVAALSTRSIGGSHDSYRFAGHQWALAIDGAAQVGASRPDLLSSAPHVWPEVLELAKSGRVLWPLKPTDASCSFMSLMAQQGTPWPGKDKTPSSEAIESALGVIASIVGYIPARCLSMNPIETLNELADPTTSYAYSPLLFGYSNYSTIGFRERLLSFHDMAVPDGGAPIGSILGGAGIAISARMSDAKAAVTYANWIASGSCQAGLYTFSGGQAAHLDAWDSPTADAHTGGFFSGTRTTVGNAWTRPRTPGFVAFQTQAGEMINAWLRETSSVSQLARQLSALAKLADAGD